MVSTVLQIFIFYRSQTILPTVIKIPYKSYKIKDVSIFINNAKQITNLNEYSDSINYNGFKIFSKGKLKYNPKAITSGIYIKKGKMNVLLIFAIL